MKTITSQYREGPVLQQDLMTQILKRPIKEKPRLEPGLVELYERFNVPFSIARSRIKGNSITFGGRDV